MKKFIAVALLLSLFSFAASVTPAHARHGACEPGDNRCTRR